MRPECVLSKGEHAGFQFVTVHNGMGYRCGYVRIPKGHPWHGRNYGDIDVDVHGGLSFAEPDMPCDKAGDDDAYWVGFDCGHSGDAQDPSLPSSRLADFRMPFIDGDTVKTQSYVEAECHGLCEQAARAALNSKRKASATC
jgi:hypothetical protein